MLFDRDCYAYVRVSSSGQLAGFGPQRQREDIETFAKAGGYRLVQVFEEAWTGTESHRPAFMEMLAAALTGGARIVLIESLDRLARDLMVQSVLLSKFANEGLTLIAVNTGEDVTEAIKHDPMRKAMVQIQGVFAELEKTLLVRKLQRGREAKRDSTGRCEGRKPFGTKAGEEVALERIRQLRRKPRGGQRASYGAIAEVLNREPLPTRSGRPWSRSTVQKICAANGWDG